MRYLKSGDFIGGLWLLLGRSVPCRRRTAGDDGGAIRTACRPSSARFSQIVG